jgi:hypothetical protein
LYSGTIGKVEKFRVYKKDITHYRIEAWSNGQWVSIPFVEYPENLVLNGCKFVVNEAGRLDTVNNKKDGADAGVFAWIECKGFELRKADHFEKNVFFNPYRVSNFVDRKTENAIYFCDSVVIQGNILSYYVPQYKDILNKKIKTKFF